MLEMISYEHRFWLYREESSEARGLNISSAQCTNKQKDKLPDISNHIRLSLLIGKKEKMSWDNNLLYWIATRYCSQLKGDMSKSKPSYLAILLKVDLLDLSSLMK